MEKRSFIADDRIIRQTQRDYGERMHEKMHKIFLPMWQCKSITSYRFRLNQLSHKFRLFIHLSATYIQVFFRFMDDLKKFPYFSFYGFIRFDLTIIKQVINNFFTIFKHLFPTEGASHEKMNSHENFDNWRMKLMSAYAVAC